MSNMYYTKEHEWVKIDGNIATVGISDYAAHQLGDITFVELPKLGKAVKQFDVLCAIESVKAASDIYAPVSGDVVAVNEELGSTPELLNQDPYGKGWLFKVKMSDPGEFNDLLNADDYAHHIGA